MYSVGVIYFDLVMCITLHLEGFNEAINLPRLFPVNQSVKVML